MKLPELLEVHSIARLVKVQYREDKARPRMISTDATCRLNIFGGSLRLTLDNHEPKAADIETNGNHIRRQSNIYGFRFRPKTGIKALFRFRDLVRRDARGELHRFLDASVSKGSIGGSDPPALGTIARGAITNLVFDNSARATQLAQGVEIAQGGHIGIGRISDAINRRLVRVIGCLGSGNEDRAPGSGVRAALVSRSLAGAASSCQVATAGSLTMGSSLNGAIVSRVM